MWKGKSESEKVNEVNGELGESVGFANVIFQRTEMRRILNIIYNNEISRLRLLNTINYQKSI